MICKYYIAEYEGFEISNVSKFTKLLIIKK